MVFTRLPRLEVAGQSLAATVGQVADLAHTLIPRASNVSVTLLDPRAHAPVVAFSAASTAAVVLDERQYAASVDPGAYPGPLAALGALGTPGGPGGPGGDAADTGQSITVSDTGTDTRWGSYCQAAARAGVGHIHAIGIPALDQTSTAVTFYRDRSGPFTAFERRLATRFSTDAAIILTHAAEHSVALHEPTAPA